MQTDGEAPGKIEMIMCLIKYQLQHASCSFSMRFLYERIK